MLKYVIFIYEMEYVMSFTLLEQKYLLDVDSTGYLYEHEQTKAQVFYLANDDTNKTFSITFKTLPYDENGIAHILEHSVLCGSKKYPTKEPFVELAKGSLNTFLNAMTFPDKTMYPISSINDKDFTNLMDVYLDAVFFPNFKTNDLILKQEGWHYHLENITDDLTYRGVVYNEMKGALSDPEEIIGRSALAALFPNSIYALEYGGDPLDIPTLTQEKFIDFHNRYYHPSNAYTFLYGKLNIEEKLNHLDSYFNQFTYQAIDTTIPIINSFDALKTVETYFPIEADEDEHNKTHLSLEFVIGETKDIKNTLYLSLLSEILMGNNASPLRKKLLAANIASDISSYVSRSTQQATMDITVKNSEKKYAQQFKTIVFDTLKELTEKGIEPQLFEAALNQFKFNIIESQHNSSYSKGVAYAQSMLQSWLYNGSAFSSFEYMQYLKDLENDPNVLVQLIKQKLLNNTHAILLIGLPQKNMNSDKYEQVHQQLQQFKSTLSQNELEQLVNDTHQLIAYQNQTDTKTDLEKLPLLTLNDIDDNVTLPTLEKEKYNHATILHLEQFTNAIDYIDFKFDLSHFNIEQLQYAALISQLLKNVPTQHSTLETLTLALNTHIGGIVFNTHMQTATTNDYPCLTIRTKAFHHKSDYLWAILKDIITNSQFNDAKRIKDELLKIKTNFDDYFYTSGHAVSAYYVNASISQTQKLESILTGVDYYQFIVNLIHKMDNHFDDIQQQLSEVFKLLLSPIHLNILFTGVKEHYHIQLPNIKQFIEQLNVFLPPQMTKNLEMIRLNDSPIGLSLATDANYVVQGGKTNPLSAETFGQLTVLKQVLDYDYLWNNVRVKNGAYGGFSALNRRGHILLLSYRDPSVDDTLTIYKNISQFIQSLTLDNRELTKVIIGVFSHIDKPKSPKQMANMLFDFYLNNITHERLQAERTAILTTTCEAMRKFHPLFDEIITQQKICVIGSKQSLERSQFITQTQSLILPLN